MPFFDMPLEDLERYQPDIPEPADFDAFWAWTLDEARQFPLNPIFTEVDHGLRAFTTYDVSFCGWGGQTIKGWFIVPRQARGPLPAVLEFIGYGGGRGRPLNWLTYPAAGFATLVMDTRGQGSTWLSGDTPDLFDQANPFYPGFMTQGILSPASYYYRRVFTDGVRALEALASHSLVDGQRIALSGGSQGGGISLAVGGLAPQVRAVLADVPFLCHFQRAVGLSPDRPYTEITDYLKIHRAAAESVFSTLNYFDGVHFARRIQGQAFFSVALMDTICPPSTVFAAYHAVRSPKSIKVYAYNNHEGGGSDHAQARIDFLHGLFGR